MTIPPTFTGGFLFAISTTTIHINMTNPNALWEDMKKLNDLYEELNWDPDDQLTFKIVRPDKGCAYIAVENLTQCVRGFLS